MASSFPISHHIRALPPALKAMEAMGYNPCDCLDGTGIEPGDLLGLKPGQAYTVQTYGLFGYAFMSAPTLRCRLAHAFKRWHGGPPRAYRQETRDC